MKNRKYSLVFIMLLCMIMAVSAFPMTVNADMGPKASVRIQFEHMGDELCYGTLLSKEKSTGPASAWDGRTESAQKEYMDPGIWEIFVTYKDPDGYYFLQRSWKVSESKELAWTYYPPDDFKILLYYRKRKPLYPVEFMLVMHLIRIIQWIWMVWISVRWNTMMI